MSSNGGGGEESGRAQASRRRVVALATLGAGGAAGGGGILGACAPGEGSGGPPATAGSGQPARLVWLNWEGSGASLEGNTKTIKSFQAQHPRITVENAAQTAGGATYWDKHAALKASGAPPDLWEWEPQHVVDNVLRKQVLDLQPLVARDRYDLSDFFARGIDQYRYRSGLWGLPRDFPNRELAYSVTAFEKEGLRPPRRRLEEPGLDLGGLPGRGPPPDQAGRRAVGLQHRAQASACGRSGCGATGAR